MFEHGQRVKVSVLDTDLKITGYRSATVNYVRASGPLVHSYSVLLDDQLHRSNYEGSIFAPDRIFKDE